MIRRSLTGVLLSFVVLAASAASGQRGQIFVRPAAPPPGHISVPSLPPGIVPPTTPPPRSEPPTVPPVKVELPTTPPPRIVPSTTPPPAIAPPAASMPPGFGSEPANVPAHQAPMRRR